MKRLLERIREMKAWHVVWLEIAFFGVIILASLPWTGPAMISYIPVRVITWNWTKADYEGYDKWRNEPVVIPSEARDAPMFSQETIDAACRFNKEIDSHYAYLRETEDEFSQFCAQTSNPITTEAIAKLEADITTLSLMLDAFRDMATRPDYEIDVTVFGLPPKSPIDSWGYPDIPNCWGILQASRRFAAQAVLSIRDRRFKESFDMCKVVFQGARYYSVGPDKIDQNMSIPYDPTNGTISPGDIWLEAPKWDSSR